VTQFRHTTPPGPGTTTHGVCITDSSGAAIRAIARQEDAALGGEREGAHPGDRQRGVEAPGRAATQRGEGQKGEGKARSQGVLGCRAKECRFPDTTVV